MDFSNLNSNADLCSADSRDTGSKTVTSTPSVSSRRSSFLSKTMLDSESFSIYDTYNYSRGSVSNHVISLKESQGFLFNQDLFASAYQQSRALVREKQERALFSKKRSKSHGYVSTPSSSGIKRQQQRRYTSINSTPFLQVKGDDIAIDEMTDDDMCIDDFASGQGHIQAIPPASFPKAMSYSEDPKDTKDTSRRTHGLSLGDTAVRLDNVNWSDASGDSEVEESQRTFSSIGSNYVPVIDISVDDMDHIPDL